MSTFALPALALGPGHASRATWGAWYSFAVALVLVPTMLRGQVRDEQRFILATVVLTIYVLVEVGVEVWRDRKGWLLNPAVLASIMSFILPLTLSNYTLLDVTGPGYTRMSQGLEGANGFFWLARAMDIVPPAALAMWLGFRARLGARVGRSLQSWLRRHDVLRAPARPRDYAIPVLVMLAFGARAIQLKLGVLGYAADVESLYTHAKYTMILTTLSDFGRLALVLVALEHFSTEGRSRRSVLLVLLALEIGFGFVLGFKGRVVFPLITVATCLYAIRGRVQLRYVVATVFALAAAYAVIEPFRLIRYIDPEFNSRSFTSIVSTLRQASLVADDDIRQQYLRTNAMEQTALRVNTALDAAVTMRYVDTHGIPPDAPAFLNNLLTSPVQAVVPRLVWPTKPIQNIGVWYAQTVWKQENNINSLGMSPFGYLYFAGGSAMIIMGFAMLGMFQRTMFEAFRWAGLGGLLIYLPSLRGFVIADSAFYAVFAGTIQFVIVMLIVQRLVLRPLSSGGADATAPRLA